MIVVGRILIGLAFLLGALISVQRPANSVAWTAYAPVLALGFAGVIIARVAARHRARDVPALGAGVQRLQQSLKRVVANLSEIERDAAGAGLDTVHLRIDTLLRPDLDLFAEGRSAIEHRFGLKTYATIMNHFAAGERYLNRVWSAAVDGYEDEVRTFLARARAELEFAKQQLDTEALKME